MFAKIRRLGTDTAVYGVSTIVGRFLTFLLTPLYANVLAPAELGVAATLYAYIAFLNVVYAYGMEPAYMKYASSDELATPKQTFTVPFLSVSLSSVLLSGLIMLLAHPLTQLGRISAGHSSLVAYTALILCFDAAAVVPFASLRMAGKAKQFATIRLANIIINVGCNLLFLVNMQMGLEGIFLANAIASGLTLLLLLPTILQNFTWGWNRSLYRALLRFGLPLVPSYLAAMMIQVIDRPILEALTDKATVGIYQANYRLGIVMMLVVSMVDFAWRPFFFTTAGEPDAKNLFARVLTYFVLFMATVFLVMSFFLKEAVTSPLFWGHPLFPEAYWTGLSIVPVVLLAYIFLGISNTISAGMYIEKRTGLLPLVTFIGAGVNVAANLLLIPPWGIMGAAVATLLSYATMCATLYVIVQKVYAIQYEYARLGKIAFATGVTFLLHRLLAPTSFTLLWSVGMLALFGVAIWWMKFLNAAERAILFRLFRRRQGEPAPGPPPEL